jgi:hypothetical protein
MIQGVARKCSPFSHCVLDSLLDSRQKYSLQPLLSAIVRIVSPLRFDPRLEPMK